MQMKITRRNFIGGMAVTSLMDLVPQISSAKNLETQKNIIAGPGRSVLMDPGDKPTNLWLYNGSLPGPELRIKVGDKLNIHFQNKLTVPTTIHWHGVKVPNAMDGVAGLTQPAVEPDETFSYKFKVSEPGTYWYHAHTMGWEQVARGLYGALIVDGIKDFKVDHDITMMVDDWRLDKDGQIDEASMGSLHDWAHRGRLGNWLTVNGKSQYKRSVKFNSRIRLRLINAANARILKLELTGGVGLQVSLDGNPSNFASVSKFEIAPAQRIDLIVDVGTKPVLLHDLSSREKILAGIIEPRSELGQGLVNRGILEPSGLKGIPHNLNNAIRLKVHMQGGAMGNLSQARFKGENHTIRHLARVEKKVWAFNGVVGTYEHELGEVARGKVVILEVFNDTSWPHAMHLHGHDFWIRTSKRSNNHIDVKRDTYLMSPKEKAELIFVADNPGQWLLHCHMLEHMASGMGAVISVV